MKTDFDRDIVFAIALHCDSCGARLSADNTGFHEDTISGDDPIKVSPCQKCVDRQVKEVLKADNITNWKTRCENYRKRCANMKEKLLKLSIEYNKLASPPGPRTGAGKED